MTLPAQYLILRQPAGQPARIFHGKDGVEAVIFEGPRWPAKWTMDSLAHHPDYSLLRRFNQKRGRNGHPGSIVELVKQEAAS